MTKSFDTFQEIHSVKCEIFHKMKSVMNVQRNSFWSNFLLKRLFPFHDEDDVDRPRCNVEMNSFNALNRREKKLER